LANSGSDPTASAAIPAGKKPKRKIRKFLGIGVALVVIILVLAFVFGGFGSSSPKPTFAIVYHDAVVESNTTTGFNVTVYFRVNNTGIATGNVTVIFKVISGSYSWAGAQIFNNVAPGQSLYSYKKHIPVLGDPNGNWVYECYVNGEKAVKYPHS